MEDFVVKEGRKLKCGFTTGSCATGAAKACAEMLLTDKTVAGIAIDTPKGIRLNLQVEGIIKQQGWVSCAVTKDAGDDPDVTHGIRISARVEKIKNGCNPVPITPDLKTDDGKYITISKSLLVKAKGLFSYWKRN